MTNARTHKKKLIELMEELRKKEMDLAVALVQSLEQLCEISEMITSTGGDLFDESLVETSNDVVASITDQLIWLRNWVERDPPPSSEEEEWDPEVI